MLRVQLVARVVKGPDAGWSAFIRGARGRPSSHSVFPILPRATGLLSITRDHGALLPRGRKLKNKGSDDGHGAPRLMASFLADRRG